MRRPRHSPIAPALFALAAVGCSTGVDVLTPMGPCADPAAAGQTALSSDAFLDMVGVDVFPNYPGTAYTDMPVVGRHLRELGVRRVNAPAVVRDVGRRLQDMAKEAGIVATVKVGDARYDVQLTPEDCAGKTGCRDVVAFAGEMGAAMDTLVLSATDDELADPAWVTRTRDRVTALRATLDENPATEHVRIVSPLVSSTRAAQQVLPIAEVADLAGGFWTAIPDPPGVIMDRLIGGFVSQLGPKPKAMFMMYWNVSGAVTEAVRTKYVLRGLLEAWTRRLSRVYLHELYDLFGAGLIRTDLTPKPVYTAVSRLLQLFGPRRPAFVPGRLDFSLTGASSAVHQALLQNGEGAFFLILWRERPSTVEEPAEPVALTLRTRIATAEVHAPFDAVEPLMREVSPAGLSLSVPDHPIVVKLVPACR